MQDTVRKDRDKYIGGSDVAAIMGLSPFIDRYTLLLMKAGLKENEFEGNEYTRYGETMEPFIRDYISEYALIDFKEDKRIDGKRRYHADGYGDNVVLEIKTTSQMHEHAEDYKGYMVQLQMGIDMFDADYGILAVYERPEDFDTTFDPFRLQIFKVSRDESVISEVRKSIDVFLLDLEYLKKNPMSADEQLPSRHEIVPIVEKALALESHILELKAAESELKSLKAKLKELMTLHAVDSLTMLNNTRITLVADGKDEEVYVFNEEKFKNANPSIWESYAERKTKKGRAGYVRITPPRRGKKRADV